MWGIDTKIRPAQFTDAPSIAGFNLLLAAETEDLSLDPARVRAGVEALLRDSSKGTYYVAEFGGEVVGQLMITYEWSDWRNGNIWWIQSVFVEKRFRGKGVFARLFRYVRELACQRQDVAAIRLYMHHANQAARKAYETLGMRRTHYEVFELELTTSHVDGA